MNLTVFTKLSKVFIFFVVIACQSHSLRVPTGGDDDLGFDEVFTRINGQRVVRPAYHGIHRIFSGMDQRRFERVRDQSLRDFMGDNPLLPLPRVFTEDEFSLLRRGVEQRGNALRLFLEDHFSGEKSYLKAGVIPREVIEQIIKRNQEWEWQYLIRPENLNFWYGPDVIRGPPSEEYPEGRFFVIEDNPSYIGGVGDLKMARESLFANVPEYKNIFDSPDPDKYYNELAEYYKKEAAKYGGEPVMVQYSPLISADNEDRRVRKLMRERGVEVVNIDPFNPDRLKAERLEIIDGNAYLVRKHARGKKVIKVGYLISNMDPDDLDPGHPANFSKRLLKEAEEHLEQDWQNVRLKNELAELLKPNESTGLIDLEALYEFLEFRSEFESTLEVKQGVPGLMDLVTEGKIGMTNPPGLEFIGDKQFYLYIDELIRFYLQQEPVLSNIQTGTFMKEVEGRLVFDEDQFQDLFDNFQKYVVKPVDGRGGDGVLVGPKATEDEILATKAAILDNPSKWIWQEFTPLSTMDRYIGDTRLVSQVVSGRTMTAPVSWARVNEISGDGKVNISANGFEATVLVRKIGDTSCYGLMQTILVKAQ